MTIAFAIVLLAILSALTWFDIRRMILPNALNAALGLSGLTYQWLSSTDTLALQLGISAATFGIFWLVRRAHFAATGRIGLGFGDVKMAGAAATWLNPLLLPVFVFVASCSALLWLLARAATGGSTHLTRRQPFGPFLAIGLALTWAIDTLSLPGISL